MITKHCPSCDNDLPVTAFGNNRQTPDGLMYYCRLCASEKQRQYREANPDAAAAAKARYLEKLRSRNDAARAAER